MHKQTLIAKAEECIKQAKNCERKIPIFKEPDYSEALDFWKKGANYFKLAGDTQRAKELYVSVANCALKLGYSYEAGVAYEDAYNVTKDVGYATDKVDLLQAAINHYTDSGHIIQIAKLQSTIGDIYVSEKKYSNAFESFRESSETYDLAPSTSITSSKVLQKAGDIALLDAKRYETAIEFYEDAFDLVRSSNLALDISINKYLLKVVLCYILISDVIQAQRTFEKWINSAPSYKLFPDYNLINGILQCFLQDKGLEDFQRIMQEYDRSKIMEPWLVELLLVVKDKLTCNDNDDLC